MTEVIMPKMGDGMEEGTLLEWLKKEGDEVKSGEILGNIQTDKATLELESPGKGRLAGILVQPGETVPVGKPIAALLKAGENLPAGWGSGVAATATAASPEPSVTASVPELKLGGDMGAAVAAPAGGRVIASPLARKIAAESGVELAALSGSGPGGRIVERDVLVAIERSGAAPSPQPIAASGEDKIVPLNRLRQITAQRTQHSKQTVPHFYVTVEVDLEAIDRLREMFAADEAGKLSINDFVIAASVKSLAEMPEANATFENNTIRQYGAIHIGVAAAVDEGLLVPVIKNAQTMTIRQLSARAKELVGKAREGKLHPDEMQGSTFSISNMGMLNVENFAAIINEPNSAIIAVSTAGKKVVVNEEDELEIRNRMNVTGSFDHRVLDGATGAKFMNILRDYLQNPTRLLS